LNLLKFIKFILCCWIQTLLIVPIGYFYCYESFSLNVPVWRKSIADYLNYIDKGISDPYRLFETKIKNFVNLPALMVQ